MDLIVLLRSWEVASVVFFAYTVAAALAVSRLPRRNRLQALSGTCAGFILTILSIAIPANVVLHGWVLPPALLLLAYWSSGRLFVAPMPAAERALMRLDDAIEVRRRAAAAPRWLVEILEFSYAGVYLLVPAALIVATLFTTGHDPDRFWTVILVTDYVCFAVLPWVQTRPPRSIEPGEPWRSAFRPFNLQILGAASIRVNTFPSGHAAEALAAALLVIGAPLPLVVAMFGGALAISTAAVGGRYHYAADALLGWAVAVVVWMAV